MSNISTESYKGVRDFYPEDMFVQKYIFSIMRRAAERYGYVEYGASILEPTELYKAKTGEEIVNEQTYSFRDRGERDVTLRPEMTPTLARMIAARRRELASPLRWYSIPNLFRYEKPQRGRLREHFQLNVDIFGISSTEAEFEVISIASDIMKLLGARTEDFEIRINSRKILEYLLGGLLSLPEKERKKITRIIDKKNKISADEFKEEIEKILREKTESFISLLTTRTAADFQAALHEQFNAEAEGLPEVVELIEHLKKHGITNTVFDPTLARGFDYYTGIVFEVFDTDPKNSRSLFGGGRYDDLLSVFGTEKMPAVGFGMGDVRIHDFLEIRGLLPTYSSSAHLYICNAGKVDNEKLHTLASVLREQGLNVAVDYTNRKIGDQIKAADRLAIPYIIVVGEDELSKHEYTVKHLSTGNEKTLTEKKIGAFILETEK